MVGDKRSPRGLPKPTPPLTLPVPVLLGCSVILGVHPVPGVQPAAVPARALGAARVLREPVAQRHVDQGHHRGLHHVHLRPAALRHCRLLHAYPQTPGEQESQLPPRGGVLHKSAVI